MRIVAFTVYSIRVPLKRTVTHASATRAQSDNLLVQCKLASGIEGWGEGVPRAYVTGETVAGAFQQLAAIQWASQFGVDCTNWEDVLKLCERIDLRSTVDDPRGCYGNALRCALELSILDAFGRLFAEPLCAATQHFEPARSIRARLDRVRYSGAITAEGPWSELAERSENATVWISTL